ncbi:MAG: LysR substrate-binding domain-containing protein [Burkholderiaceae bacterium]
MTWRSAPAPCPTPPLVARRIGDLERVICASPGYLRQFGTPAHPRDLLEHNCMVLNTNPTLRRWRFRDPSDDGGGSGRSYALEVGRN